MSSEYHGKDCFLIASQIAHGIADRAKAAADAVMCDVAVVALSRVSFAWEVGLIDIPMSEVTKSQMQGMADIAETNSEYYETNDRN